MFNIEYDVVDELAIGDTKMRLVETHGSKSRKIQLWSSLSKQWNVTHRYNVADEWLKWKTLANKLNVRSKKKPKARKKK